MGSTELGGNPVKSSLPNMDSLAQMNSKRRGKKWKENITGFYLPKLQGPPQQVRDRALRSSSAVSHTQCKLGVSVQHATVCFFAKKNPKQVVLFSLCAFVLKLQRVSETCKQGCQLIRTILYMKHTQYRDTSCSM